MKLGIEQRKPKMNLVTDPWIPVLKADGTLAEIGLHALFEQADKIRDISAMPHERIALYRLLICITQAALDGPSDRYAWEGCTKDISPKSIAYLDEWKDAFNLFGDGPRFLQVKSPRHDTDKPTPLYKMGFVDADGSTLFDQHIQEGISFDPKNIAKLLLAFQSFAAGGTVEGKREVNGIKQNSSAAGAPCRDQSAFHSFLIGTTLLETIRLNLINKEDLQTYTRLDWDRPVWERRATNITDLKDVNPKGYLARLVPYSRSVWLLDNCSQALITAGVDYANFGDLGVSEVSASSAVGADEKPFLLSAESQKKITQPWRELHSLLIQRNAQKLGGVLALRNLEENKDSVLWTGAMGANQAKVIDLVESIAPIPAALRCEAGLRTYQNGIAHAEDWQRGLAFAVSIWAEKQSIEKDQRRKLAENPTLIFWTILESRLASLIAATLDRKVITDFQETHWGKACSAAACEAYERACPHDTPRQIQAYALGLKQLRPQSPTSKTPKKGKKTS
jgi:CRISPR system Cascade subunit CasA